MEIKVRVTSVNKKFMLSKPNKLIKVGRQSLYFLVYLAQRKFRDGHESQIIPIHAKYNDEIIFKCSEIRWIMLRIKGNDTNNIISGFNKIIRNFFYEDFFRYMDLMLLKMIILEDTEQRIKDFALNYMEKLNLSDDDILLETLLRNYRRYRLNPDLDIYDLIDSLKDDE
jgi:hypothetical protein